MTAKSKALLLALAVLASILLIAFSLFPETASAKTVSLEWDTNQSPDPETGINIVGYKVYYTAPLAGYDVPFAGTGALEGNSPITIMGVDNSFATVTGIPDEACYFTVTAISDVAESLHSNYAFSPTVGDLQMVAVTVIASMGGNTTPSGVVLVPIGTDRTFTATPDPDRVFVHWKKNGVNDTTSPTITLTNVTAEIALQPVFRDKTHFVWVRTVLDGSVINSASNSVSDNSPIFITAPTTPANSTLSSIKKNGVTVSPLSLYPINNVIADIEVRYEYLTNTYPVTVSIPGGGGTATPSSISVAHGGSALIQFTPEAGKRVTQLMENGVDVTSSVNSSNQYSASNISGSTAIVATFGNITVPVYRFRNLQNGGYLMTASESEKNNIIANYAASWAYEGIKFYAHSSQQSGIVPVYRFRNLQNGGYLMTASESEKNNIIANYAASWVYEGIKFYAYP